MYLRYFPLLPSVSSPNMISNVGGVIFSERFFRTYDQSAFAEDVTMTINMKLPSLLKRQQVG